MLHIQRTTRIIYFLLLTLTFLASTCGKPGNVIITNADSYSSSINTFFDNQPGDGIQTDTTWGGDTTIYL